MSFAGAGAIAGAGISSVSHLIGLSSSNKAAVGKIESAGRALASNLKQININRGLLQEDLGLILSDSAIETVKNQATAKVLASGTGTVGGTTTLIAKQAEMDSMRAEAEVVRKAKRQDMTMLTDAISKRIEFRKQARGYASKIKSPIEAVLGTMTAAIQGASAGAKTGAMFDKASFTSSVGKNTTGEVGRFAKASDIEFEFDIPDSAF